MKGTAYKKAVLLRSLHSFENINNNLDGEVNLLGGGGVPMCLVLTSKRSLIMYKR